MSSLQFFSHIRIFLVSIVKIIFVDLIFNIDFFGMHFYIYPRFASTEFFNKLIASDLLVL